MAGLVECWERSGHDLVRIIDYGCAMNAAAPWDQAEVAQMQARADKITEVANWLSSCAIAEFFRSLYPSLLCSNVRRAKPMSLAAPPSSSLIGPVALPRCLLLVPDSGARKQLELYLEHVEGIPRASIRNMVASTANHSAGSLAQFQEICRELVSIVDDGASVPTVIISTLFNGADPQCYPLAEIDGTNVIGSMLALAFPDVYWIYLAQRSAGPGDQQLSKDLARMHLLALDEERPFRRLSDLLHLAAWEDLPSSIRVAFEPASGVG